MTATLPLDVARDRGRWRSGRGDVELGLKYRFFDDPRYRLSAAIFPRVILPTAGNGVGSGQWAVGSGHTRLLLPLGVQQDMGQWSVFGGGGYVLNPGAGNRDFWQAGVAVTRQVNSRLSIGGEITREGPDAVGGASTTSLGVGSIVAIAPSVSVLLRGGSTFSCGNTGYRSYAALGFDF
ncbi:MAG: hypothetical protein LH610_00900 [Sphingomonas bacterium]|nr:hypothetical protein [Sphingomonas bacterium]